MDIAIASTAGQAFHLLSPLVGFIYLLLHITGVEMGKWQIQSAKWAIGIFVAFSLAIFTMGDVPLWQAIIGYFKYTILVTIINLLFIQASKNDIF